METDFRYNKKGPWLKEVLFAAISLCLSIPSANYDAILRIRTGLRVLQRVQQFLEVAGPDAETRWRGRNILILSFSLAGLSLLPLATLPLISPASNEIFSLTFGTMLCYIASIIAVRRGRVTLGAWFILGGLLAVVNIGMLTNPGNLIAPHYLLLLPILAGLLLGPRQIAIFGAITLLSSGTILYLLRDNYLTHPQNLAIIVSILVLIILLGSLSMVGAISTTRALRDATQAGKQVDDALDALEQANNQLESQVKERTAALTASLAEQQMQAEQLRESFAAQERLNDLIAELSVPVIPVRHDILVVPLVGSIDGERAEHSLLNILREVEHRRARFVVIDVTGVVVIDTRLAKALLNTAEALRLLGAETMIVGVRPHVSQTLVSLGADLSEIRTAATLADGLSELEGRALPSFRSRENMLKAG